MTCIQIWVVTINSKFAVIVTLFIIIMIALVISQHCCPSSSGTILRIQAYCAYNIIIMHISYLIMK